MDRVKLNILGISYNPVKKNAFVLVLAQEDGPYRIPIVIGAAEAQSIAIKLEGVVTPRPMTHDLFVSFAHAFKVELREVFIYNFEDGIFSAELTFTDGEKEVKLDSRTSDAVAIALRTGASIYTTPEILTQRGAIWDEDSTNEKEDATAPDRLDNRKGYERMSDEELRKRLQQLIDNDDYEEAAKVSEELKRRGG